MTDAEKRKRSCVTGYLLSLVGKPQPISVKKRLLGYFYNRTAVSDGPDVPVTPDEPTGVYDDKLPIEWNTADIAGNVAVDAYGTMYVKISNLTPTIEELATLKAVVTVDGSVIELVYAGIQPIVDNLFQAVYASGSIVIIFVVATQPTEVEGIIFPEAGIYVEYDSTVAAQYSLKKLNFYLYNGVELPDINTVWTDKETDPHATITYSATLNLFALYTTEGTFFWDNDISRYRCDGKHTQYYLTNNVWVKIGTNSGMYLDCNYFEGTTEDNCHVWSDYDILKEDGTTFFATSEPVPVYE